MKESPAFLTLENPLVVGVLVFLIIIVLIFVFSKYFYFPLVKKYFQDKEKNNLISKILFETDPNPVFRIDFDGNLIQKNQAVDKLVEKHKIDFNRLLEDLKRKTDPYIVENIFEITLGQFYYEIIVKKINALKVLQFYIVDRTDIRVKEKLIYDYKRKVSLIKNKEESKFLKRQNGLARELHDSINHNLLIAIKKIEKRDNNFPELIELKKIFNDIRKCSKEIKPKNFELEDFSYILYKLVEQYRKTTNISFELTTSEIVNSLNAKILFHLYRIIQELLVNIIKYADADNVDISVYSDKRKYFLTVEDDGKGFEPQKITESYYTSTGLGIINIQERVNEIDGYWSIDSEIGRGTITIIEFSGN